MELSWTMKLRIAAAATVGVVLIGIIAWPLAAPSQTTGAISPTGGAIIVLLALLAGLIAYFVSWPHGREVGILAVPFGLTVWAVRSGTVSVLLQLNPTDIERQSLFTSLRWQSLLWLAVVAAGFVGPLLCQQILCKRKNKPQEQKPKVNPVKYLSIIAALEAAAFIAQFSIKIFAQDIRLSDETFGSVVAQPAVGQIGFAVLFSFGIAAFVVRKFLGAGYIWSIIATSLVTIYSVSVYANHSHVLAQQWPAVFFSNAASSVLPVQMAAFGTLGSIAGYWMTARFDYWRKYEM